MRVITVSREFGSGGREVAKRLADVLGITYYDKEILTAIAEESSLDPTYVKHTLENGIGSSYPLTFSHTFAILPNMNTGATQVHATQYKVIKDLASKGDCIIVGRCADTILEEYNPFRIFVYSDLEHKIARCRARASEDENLTDKQLIKLIKKVDKARAENHGLIAESRWGDKESYDLCINTAGIEIKKLIPGLADYIKQWFDMKGIE